MNKRTQLNLRFDGKEDLVEAAKQRARTLGITLTEFIVNTLEQVLQFGQYDQSTQNNQNIQNVAYNLRTSITDLRVAFMGEIRKRDARLDQQQELIGEVAHVLSQLQTSIDEVPTHNPSMLMGEIRKRDTRLDQQEALISGLAHALAQLQANIDEVPIHSPSGLIREIRKRDARLDQQEESIDELASVVAQLQANVDEVPMYNPSIDKPAKSRATKATQSKRKKQSRNDSGAKSNTWETTGYTFLDEVEW